MDQDAESSFQENVAACERLIGKPLSEDERADILHMVVRFAGVLRTARAVNMGLGDRAPVGPVGEAGR